MKGWSSVKGALSDILTGIKSITSSGEVSDEHLNTSVCLEFSGR